MATARAHDPSVALAALAALLALSRRASSRSPSCSAWSPPACRRAGSPRLDFQTACPPRRARWSSCRRCSTSVGARRGAARAPRGAGARQPRSAHPLRDPQRLPRRGARTLPDDAAILAAARDGIEALNARHAEGAAAASSSSTASGAGTRARALWMGWERKRGKIEEFNRLLRGADGHELHVQVGDLERPAVRALLHHARHRHAAAARRREEAHRHHRAPAEPPALRRAPRAASTEGYGILQPRVSVTMASAAGSLFARALRRPHRRRSRTRPPSRTSTRISSTKASSPARASTTSTRSSAALEGRVPENALLSHDLFEGLLRAHGARHRRRGRRRLPVERARPRAAPAPLGARRLADPAGGSSRSCRRAAGCDAQPPAAHLAAGRSSTTCGAASLAPAHASPCCCSRLDRAARAARARGRPRSLGRGSPSL